MKNVLVANFINGDDKNLNRMLSAQIANSKRLGWKSNDVFVVTNNVLFKTKDARVFLCDLNKICPTGSKVFGLKLLFEHLVKINDFSKDEIFWLHDLDAWQNHSFFNQINICDAGFCTYSSPKINGGSQFWKVSGWDILESITSLILSNSANKEEPSIQKICHNNDRVTILNSTYNVGCSGYVERFSRSLKPILVSHFHPTNRIAWQTHRLDRDGLGYISVSKELERLLRDFFVLQNELDSEGLQARKRKISARMIV